MLALGSQHKDAPPHVKRLAVIVRIQKPAKHRRGITAALQARRLEHRAQPVKAPVSHRVGRIVEHLPNNLTAQARIRTALDLHHGRHTVLVHEQVIDRPPAQANIIRGHPNLAGDQQPPRGPSTSIVAGQQLRMRSQQLLQIVFRRVRLLGQGDQLRAAPQIRTTCHEAQRTGAGAREPQQPSYALPHGTDKRSRPEICNAGSGRRALPLNPIIRVASSHSPYQMSWTRVLDRLSP
jgi:hypothetical protein